MEDVFINDIEVAVVTKAKVGFGVENEASPTFYGAILANMVFSPMAAKLERNSNEESVINTVFLTAAASMGRQENPRRLEMLLNTILPPAHRLQYYQD